MCTQLEIKFQLMGVPPNIVQYETVSKSAFRRVIKLLSVFFEKEHCCKFDVLNAIVRIFCNRLSFKRTDFNPLFSKKG